MKKIQNTQKINPDSSRNIILTLAVIMALQMISFGIIMPIFARRISDFGAGVEALGLMAMAYSITSIAGAPIMGTLADRVGRRPLVLGSLAAYVVAFTGYLLAPSTNAFIMIRALAGALTAGLGPSVMGIVADVVPSHERARWIGVIGGGASVGWILGPIFGGYLYDQWGFVAPFAISVVIAAIALVTAFTLIPETLPRQIRNRVKSSQNRKNPFKVTISSITPNNFRSLWGTFPQPISAFAILLLISFTTIFAYAFIEPQLMFYVYDDLGWSSTRFGLAVSGLGLTLVIGQTVLGKLSDRFGRKIVLVVGILLSTAMYTTVSVTTSFQLIFLAYVIAGLGEALIAPALSAFYLDITTEEHKSRIMGLKGAAGSLGGVAGPALAVLAINIIPPHNVFSIAVGSLLFVALLVLIVLREPRKASLDESIPPLQNPVSIDNIAVEHS